MEYRRADNFIVIRLDEDEKIYEKITEVCKKEKISSGVVHSIIGAVKQVELIMGRGIQETYTQHFEISGNGNISQVEEEPKLHLHLVCGNRQTVKMGHLVEATVTVFSEVVIQKLKGFRMKRKIDRKLIEEKIILPYILRP